VDSIAYRIAGRDLAHWSRAAASGAPSRRAAAEQRLLVVDASADAGTGTAKGAPSPHPLLLLLDPLADAAGEPAILVLREHPADLDAAQAALEAAGRAEPICRLGQVEGLADAAPGAICLLESSLEAAAPALLPMLDAAARVFVHLSPRAPSELGFPTLRALAERPNLDLLLRLPLAGLRRLAPFRGTPVADLPLPLRRLAEAYSRLLGDARYEWLALWRAVEAEAGAEAAEQRIAERSRERLVTAAPDALARAFAVHTPEDAAAGPLHFLLTTHQPERALAFNRTLFELRCRSLPQQDALPDAFVRLDTPGLLDLFSAAASAAGEPRTRSVDHPALAHHLASHFADRSLTLRVVMHHLAFTELFPEDVRRALNLLRRDRRASFRSLTAADAPVRFAPAGTRL
jgi:hypothetical protein